MAVILMYHRIADCQPDPHRLNVSPSEFREHLQYLVVNHTVMSLADLVAALLSGGVPDDAVALTLDDGTIDALTTAGPILVQEGVPATFFITTDRLEEKHEFWWDILGRIFFTDADLPPTLQLGLGAEDAQEFSTSTDAERTAAYSRIHRSIMHGSFEDRCRTMAAIESWCGMDLMPRDSHRVLLSHEIRGLAALPGQSIGAHSVHHLFIPRQSPSDQRAEIVESKLALENVIDAEVALFSYPFGGLDSQAIAMTQEAGYAGAVSTREAPISPGAEMWDLPRLDIKAQGAEGLRQTIASAESGAALDD